MEDGKLLRTYLSPHWWDLTPLEAKIVIILFWLADPDSKEVSISITSLAQRANSMNKSVTVALEKLILRGLITSTPPIQPSVDKTFKMLCKKENSKGDKQPQIPDELQYVPVNSDEQKKTPLTVNNDIDNKIYKYFIKTVNGTVASLGKKFKEFARDGNKLKPEFIAKAFKDEENLRLYKVYCERYPVEIIHKAFEAVLKTPLKRIKKSPGAYFTYLVKKYGDSTTDKNKTI